METTDNRYQFLRTLDEEALRQIVLMPLLAKMGFRDVIEYHGGSAEKGKDIVCHYSDPMNNRHYVAVIVKKGDIHGAVGKTGNASEVLYQAQQALNEPYRDIYGLTEVRINNCFIIASGTIKNTAIESVSGSLTGNNLDRLLKFIDSRRLVNLISQFMPDYWLGGSLYLSILHDMRGSLSAISSSASMLQGYAKNISCDPGRLEEIAQRISNYAENAQRIAEQQYQFATPEVRIHKVLVDVDHLIRKEIDTFSRFLKMRHNKTILYNPEGGIGEAWLDEGIFGQAFWALLDNTDKFGSEDTAIEIIAITEGPQIIIRFRNYGIGIAPNSEEAIFQPYYTGSPSGPGLGLYIARKLISAMGGILRVTNLANPTEFSIYLYRAEYDSDSR
jgi:signal transduction histidine kinase